MTRHLLHAGVSWPAVRCGELQAAGAQCQALRQDTESGGCLFLLSCSRAEGDYWHNQLAADRLIICFRMLQLSNERSKLGLK